MRSHKFASLVTAALVACITHTEAQTLPYNPTFLLQGPNNKIYQFQNTSPQFSEYDATNNIESNAVPKSITNQLPFLADELNSYIPVTTRNGLTVFTGECSEGEQELDLWTYGLSTSNQTWTQMKTTSSDAGLSANFLAAGFTFPSQNTTSEDSLYVFGGMCPTDSSNASAWTTEATYSNTMMTISPEPDHDYQVSLTGTRSPPVAEAGLSITSLLPVALKPDNTSQQQNFVLIGGHTKDAFIDMSQVAIFSMPQQSWAFVRIEQPVGTTVEPRSGHSAVLSEDGSQILVFGGWVGSVTNVATPQLVVLDIGQGYGGNGSWSWTVPNAQSDQEGSAVGIYGHGAVILPGNVMMTTGGYQIAPSKKAKRDVSRVRFYNISSATWSTNYANPIAIAAAHKASQGLAARERTGLGAGLGVGIAVLLAIAIAWFIYHRRQREQKRIREKRLREMALGTHDGQSVQELPRSGSHGFIAGLRSASWGAREEHNIGHHQEATKLPSRQSSVTFAEDSGGTSEAFPVLGPSPVMKNSLRSRGPPGFGNHILPPAPGVFTIEEVEERSERGSIKRPDTAESRPLSDPFKDPPLPHSGRAIQQPDEAAERRRREVQTWVDDWQSAADSMNVSRSPSKATSHGRTYSNLSALQSSSSSSGDRTNSNLSDRSNTSGLSKTHGSADMSRAGSQRNGNAGYSLFSSAAAAVQRFAGRQDHLGGLERSGSKRAVSTGDLAQMAARKRSNSVEQNNNPVPRLLTPQSREELNAAGDYFTPPESPIKDYKGHVRRRSNSSTSFSHSNSLTSQSKKALGVLSSAKRILTGTGSVNVSDKVNNIEAKGKDDSPVIRGAPEMAESSQRQVSGSSTSFWKHRQGARDWEDPSSLGVSSGTVRRRSGRTVRLDDDVQDEDGKAENGEDWDVEAAVQQRVVQVMFTVPKEKLRVVNADNLSLLSRSDTQASRNSDKSEDTRIPLQEKEINRMSRVTETGEEVTDDDRTVIGSQLHPESALSADKGKQVLRPALSPRKSGETIGKAF